MRENDVQTNPDSSPAVLVVDDEQSIRELLGLVLEAEGYRVRTASTGEEALAVFEEDENGVALVILDLKMPGIGGLQVLDRLRAESRSVPVIIVTAFSTWDDAVEAMRLGAYDYIRKPFDTETIRRVVRGALETHSLSERGLLGDKREGETYREIIGNHSLVQDVFKIIHRVATTDSTVLIQGESGTGKEMVARALHFRSHRRDRPFVPVNCSAFPDSLLESELFGHVRGAFTGAIEDKKGLFQVAEGGTLFLDEVGDMSLSTQVKLLRVLEERKISPVGSARLEPIDVRIVAATNRLMEQEIQKENFREDLFYRLNVIPILMPPLRDRREDIPLLVGHFLAKYSKRMKKNVTRISDSSLRVLGEYQWPGNVRELENIVQRHVALCDGDTIEDIVIASHGAAPRSATASPQRLIPADGINLEQRLDDFERQYLTEALKMTDGHMTKAAKLLGMSYRSIRYRIKKLQVRDDVEV